MIEGGWSFVWAAYALTFAALVVLALVVVLRLRHWARRAHELDRA
jgi:heme exporter protein CcmD